MERRSGSERRPDRLSLPAAIRSVDAAIDPFGIETHRIRNPERQELTVNQRKQSFGFISRCHWNILTDAEHVEAVDEVVISRVRARRVHSAFVIGARQRIESPAFRTVFAGCAWPIQRTFAFPPVEAGKLAAG